MPDPQDQNVLLPSLPGETGQLLPLNRDPSGGLHLALPGVLRGAINSTYNALVGPGEVLTGRTPTGAPASPNPLAISQDITGLALGLGQTPLGGSLPSGAMASFKGYHGTPHVFEPVEGNPFGEFRDSAIGSGEGAQVYGWGHYVAGAKETAEEYQKRLTGSTNPTVTIDNIPVWDRFGAMGDGGKEPIYNHPEHFEDAAKVLQQTGGDVEWAKNLLQHRINNPLEAIKADPWNSGNEIKQAGKVSSRYLKAVSDNAKDALAFLSSDQDRMKMRSNEGSLLHVEIKPEEHQLLDWDRQLKEQHPDVQAIVRPMMESSIARQTAVREADLDRITQARSVGKNPRLPTWMARGEPVQVGSVDTLTGEQIYKRAGLPAFDETTGQRQASERLHAAGVPGIKYLDQFSRGWDPDLTHGGVTYAGDNVTGKQKQASLAAYDMARLFGHNLSPEKQAAQSGLAILHQKGSVEAATNYLDNALNPMNWVKPASDWIKANKDKISFAPKQQQTRNYVIFHPENLKIVGRNGQMLHELAPTDSDPFAEPGTP